MSSRHCNGLMDFGEGVCSSTTSSVFGVGVQQQQRGTKRHSEEAREDVKSSKEPMLNADNLIMSADGGGVLHQLLGPTPNQLMTGQQQQQHPPLPSWQPPPLRPSWLVRRSRRPASRPSVNCAKGTRCWHRSWPRRRCRCRRCRRVSPRPHRCSRRCGHRRINLQSFRSAHKWIRDGLKLTGGHYNIMDSGDLEITQLGLSFL